MADKYLRYQSTKQANAGADPPTEVTKIQWCISVHMLPRRTIIIVNIMNKQVAAKKRRKNTRNNTIQWQSTIKDEKI